MHYLLFKSRVIEGYRKSDIGGISNFNLFGEGGNITKQELELVNRINEVSKKNENLSDFNIIVNKFDLESRYETQSKDWKDKTKI